VGDRDDNVSNDASSKVLPIPAADHANNDRNNRHNRNNNYFYT
jgi:hypothetical protein